MLWLQVPSNCKYKKATKDSNHAFTETRSSDHAPTGEASHEAKDLQADGRLEGTDDGIVLLRTFHTHPLIVPVPSVD